MFEGKRTTKRDGLADVEGIISSRIVANNTFGYWTEDGVEHYRLHNTDIVVIQPNLDIVLNSGGWKTNTTKERINRYLPAGYGICQEKGLWTVQYSEQHTTYYDGSNQSKYHKKWEVPFVDGMVLPADGSKPEVHADVELDKLRLKQIREYARECQRLADAGELPHPESGDCFECQFELRSEDYFKQAGTDHLISHLDERYIVGSLIVKAFLHSGYKQEHIGYAYAGMVWNTAGVVRKYLKFRLGYAS